jgi:type IV pilus assembly protein PilM
VPRFVRIIPMGGADITDAIAERLGVTLEDAEGIKQVTGFAEHLGNGGDLTPEAKVIEATGATFVDEVRTSLEYYKAQPTAYPIGRVVLTGGGTRLTGLADRLAAATRLRVQDGSVLSTVRLGKLGLDHDQLAYVDPLASVPVGLAMGVAS